MESLEKEDFIFKEECYKIIGCCMEVHKTLGNGFLEAVYQEALAIEFEKAGIPFEQEKQLEISYKGIILEKKYYSDFFCYESIIVELKASDAIYSEYLSQILNYLKASQNKVGLIVNFGATSLQYKRLIL